MPKGDQKIILVEDDPAIIDIYQSILEKANFDIEVLTSGNEAMKRVKEIQAGEKSMPSILLLDLVLPDINGIEILGEIRKNDITKSMKVFILTNQSNVTFEESDALKPDNVLIKANITPSELVAILKKELSVS